MTSLYVDRKGVEIRVDAETLVFREAGERVGCVPLRPLDRIYLRGDVTLQASVLGKLGEHGIGVVVMSGRKGEATLLMHRPHNDASRRIAQYRLSLDPAKKLELARGFVLSKLDGQVALLRRLAHEQPMRRYLLSTACRRVEAARPAAEEATSVASLRGAEGAAAQAHFGGLQEVFAPALKFTSRNRRPPRDPVNAVLSLGYTMLHAECVLQLYGAGLDPFIGFLHELDFGRESLACDVAEPSRPAVDSFVQRLFGKGALTAEHFSLSPQGACLLGKAGRSHFYAHWETELADLRREVTLGVAALCHAVSPQATAA